MSIFNLFEKKRASEQKSSSYLSAKKEEYERIKNEFESIKKIVLQEFYTEQERIPKVLYDDHQSATHTTTDPIVNSIPLLNFEDSSYQPNCIIPSDDYKSTAYTRELKRLDNIIAQIKENKYIYEIKTNKYRSRFSHDLNLTSTNLIQYHDLLYKKHCCEEILRYPELIETLKANSNTNEPKLIAAIRKHIKALVPYIEAEVAESNDFVQANCIISSVKTLLDTTDTNGIEKHVFQEYRMSEHGPLSSMYSINNFRVKQFTNEVSGHSNLKLMLASAIIIASALFTLFIGTMLLTCPVEIAPKLTAQIVCYCASSIVALGCIGLGVGYKKTGFAKQLSNIVDARVAYENSLPENQNVNISDRLSDCIFGCH